jgi:hypothetical protein
MTVLVRFGPEGNSVSPVDKVIGRSRWTFRNFFRREPWSRDPDGRGSTRESKQEEKARTGGPLWAARLPFDQAPPSKDPICVP